MKIVFLFLVLVAAPQRELNATESVHGSESYLKRPATEKSAIIWRNCKENENPTNWIHKIFMLGILVETMCPTFRTKGDQLPWALFSYRKKYIHTVGTIAKVQWKNKGGHDYTGIFKGASYGFARLSMAGKPNPKKLLTVPGMALKFVRDKVDSANLVAMFSVDGQRSWDFFKNDFSNHISPTKRTDFMARKLMQNFATSTNNIGQVGISDFARYGEDGQEIDKPKFPYKLRFHSPNGSRHDDAYRRPFLDDLKDLKKGGLLYEIYALDKPVELQGKEKYIGDLVLVSDMTTSMWADERLFFRHQDIADDFQTHPEWNKYTSAYRKVDPAKVKCPFH